MAASHRVSIVGWGRCGGSIGLALHRAGRSLEAVWSRSETKRESAAAAVDAAAARSPAEAAREAGIVIVAVPDDAIESVVQRIAGAIRPGALVAHTSGVTSVEVLGPVRDAGGRIGSVHPLQTLPDPERGSVALAGVPVAVTADPDGRADLCALAESWGGRPFDLPDDARTLYHAAAVLASGGLVAALAGAEELAAAAGLPSGLFSRLSETAVANASELGPRTALTGPVVRRDIGTLRRHIDAIKALGADAEAVLDAYRALAIAAARTAGIPAADVEDALG